MIVKSMTMIDKSKAMIDKSKAMIDKSKAMFYTNKIETTKSQSLAVAAKGVLEQLLVLFEKGSNIFGLFLVFL